MTEKPTHLLFRIIEEAMGYFELDMFEDAAERLRQVREDFGIGSFLLLEAECLRALGRFAEAAERYEQLLDFDGQSVEAAVGLGWCRKRLGRLDLALDAMRNLLAEKPAEPVALYNLACYLALAGEQEEALERLARAIAIEPRFAAEAAGEEDFAAIRDDPRFTALARKAEEQEEGRTG